MISIKNASFLHFHKKLPKNVGYSDELIVAKFFKNLPKVE